MCNVMGIFFTIAVNETLMYAGGTVGLVFRMRRQEKARQLIEKRRQELGLRRKDLAGILGVTPSAITRKMNGENPLTDADVRKLSDFLNIPDLFAYPAMVQDHGYASDMYEPRLKIINDAMACLGERDKADVYFLIAVVLEGKLPQATFGTILRSLANKG